MKKKTYASGLLLAIASLSLVTGNVTHADDDKSTVSTAEVLPTTEQSETNGTVATTEITSHQTVTDKTETTPETAEIARVETGSSGDDKETSKSAQETVIDDSKVQSWLTKHQFQMVQTLFRTDIEGKEIYSNVLGYQAPIDLTGYTYLSTIATTTDKGPALVHIYRDQKYVDQSIVRTEYLDGTSGKKIQADQKGQVFQASIGDRHYYNGIVVDENGEKVYKIFYLTDADYIAYAGSQYYVRLTDYTKFIDKSTGQEIATRQDGFVPVYEVAGYHYLSGEIIEEDGVTYFVQSFEKGDSKAEAVTVSDKKTPKVSKRPNSIIETLVKNNIGLPYTGEKKSKLGLVGLITTLILGGFMIYANSDFSKKK